MVRLHPSPLPSDLTSAVSLQFQCDGCTAAGVAAAAGFAEICLQFTEADTVNQSGGRAVAAPLLPPAPHSCRVFFLCLPCLAQVRLDSLHITELLLDNNSCAVDCLDSQGTVPLQFGLQVEHSSVHFTSVPFHCVQKV